MSEANPALERLVGPTLGASLRAIAGERCHPDDLEALLAAFGAVEAGPGLHPSISFRVADDAGHWVHLSAIANNQLADSDVQGIVINARDVTVETERIIQTERNQQSLVDAFTPCASDCPNAPSGRSPSVPASTTSARSPFQPRS
jgi:hypothetical protein